MSLDAIVTQPSLAIVFATSPTGLGHLRVTDALSHGLPKTTSAVLLGAQDPSVSAIYRFVSIHPFTRKIMEALQTPALEGIFAVVVRGFMRTRTKLLYQQLKTILNERFTVPSVVLIVASHSTLGHQLGEIKKTLAQEMGMTILLVVQVTDDSPQVLWYVHEADLIVVPSNYTKDHLLEYAKKEQLPSVPIVVTSYPVSPSLAEELPHNHYIERMQQMDSGSYIPIHMTVPVSGAAVGTSFLSTYMQKVYELNGRFMFHVITRDAGYTESFIRIIATMPFVKCYTSEHDRTTVHNYERVFSDTVISLEITKPSEQAFKALVGPKQIGGVIMLFSTPVGRQEYDNLHFLRTHSLMPTKKENEMLWNYSEEGTSIRTTDLISKAHHWRAISLPEKPEQSAIFTQWCLEQGVFSLMMQYRKASDSEEVQSNGVEQFWKHVAKYIQKAFETA